MVAYSKGTFRVLHDERALSVHFMLDVDGTIYQTLDVKVRMYSANLIPNTHTSRSVHGMQRLQIQGLWELRCEF